jgi:hypothetical protein
MKLSSEVTFIKNDNNLFRKLFLTDMYMSFYLLWNTDVFQLLLIYWHVLIVTVVKNYEMQYLLL